MFESDNIDLKSEWSNCELNWIGDLFADWIVDTKKCCDMSCCVWEWKEFEITIDGNKILLKDDKYLLQQKIFNKISAIWQHSLYAPDMVYLNIKIEISH